MSATERARCLRLLAGSALMFAFLSALPPAKVWKATANLAAPIE